MRHYNQMRAGTVLLAVIAMVFAAAAPTLPAGAASERHTAAGPVRGGTLHVAYGGGFATLDPAQASATDWWLMMGTLYNGLYILDRAGQPQLDLAAAPPIISADGRTWTFHIRKGVRFSNGLPLTANDIRFSITRTLDPHLKPVPSWGQVTDEIFQGSVNFATGKAKSVSGIQVLDPYTIRFVLTKPVPILPYILSESFNLVVPQAVVTKESADQFGASPVGSGPFMLQSWGKSNRLVFVRDPHYFHSGKPYLDKLIVDTNEDSSLIALQIEKGQVMAAGIAGIVTVADLQHASADPKYAQYIVTAPNVLVVQLDMNVHMAPFDKLPMRQAVAMAINRDRLVRLEGGYATQGTQLYPPAYKQYDPSLQRHPVYAYDPQRARALVAASGYKGQPISLMYGNSYQNLALGLQQDLQQIGLNVTLRSLSANSLNGITASLTGHQLSLTQWGPDYLDAYDVYSGELSCAANAAGAVYGPPHYCDPTADAMVNKAESLPLGAQRDALLRAVQVRLLKAAPIVPLVYPKQLTMVSPKVGGFYFQPIFAMQYENYWLKS